MLKKQTITTEEYNSTGDLTRRIVEENEFSEDTPLQVPYQIPYHVPCSPGDTTPVKPWWQDVYCTGTKVDGPHSNDVSTTCSREVQNGEN